DRRLEVPVPEGVVPGDPVGIEPARGRGVLRVDALRDVERMRVVTLPKENARLGELAGGLVLLRGLALHVQVTAETDRDDHAERAQREPLVLLPPRGDAAQDLGPFGLEPARVLCL